MVRKNGVGVRGFVAYVGATVRAVWGIYERSVIDVWSNLHTTLSMLSFRDSP